MRTTWLLLALALTSACITKPPVAPGAVEVVTYPTWKEELPNGMQLVIERCPQFGGVGAAMTIDAGSAREPPNRAGLAHLTEHLVFQAKHDGKRSVWDTLLDLGGGNFNGMTSWDSVTYFAFVPEKNLAKLLELFARVGADPLAGVEEADFAHELQIVRNEARLRTENGTPGQALGLLAAKVFDPEHPYHHPVVGTHETLQAITLEDARAFARASYASAPATLVVTAPYPRDLTLAMVKRAFAGASQRRESAYDDGPLPYLPPRQPLTTIQEHRAAIPAPTLWLGWLVPGAYGASGEVPRLLADMIDGTFFANVDERDSDIARVEADYWPGRRASLFYVTVTLNQGVDPRASAQSVLDEMRRGMSDRAFGGDWFERIKQWVAVQHTYEEEHVVARLLNLTTSAHVRGDPQFLRRRGQRTLRVASSQLASYWRDYLSPENASAILVRPLPESERGAIGPVGLGTSPPSDSERDAIPDASELRAWMRGVGASQAKRGTLANGLEVIVLSKPGSPFQTALVGFRGGEAFGDKPGAALAALWGRQWSGVHPSERGASYKTWVSADSSIEQVRSTGADVGLMLGLLNGVMKGSSVRWPTPQFTEQFGLFQKEFHSPHEKLHREVREALYRDHPYGVEASPDDLKAIRANHVYAWKDQVRRPENGVLVLVGSFDPQATLDAVGAELSSWQNRATRKPPNEPPPPIEHRRKDWPRVAITHLPGSTQARLRFSCLLPALTPGTEPAVDLFEQMLSSRLHTRFRARTGTSYSVGSSITKLWGGTTSVSASADIDYPRLRDALKEIRAFAELPPESYFSPALLDSVRATMARAYVLRHATTEDIATDVFSAWKLGFPLETLDSYPEAVVNTSFSDVARVAQHCGDNWVLGLLGDEPTLRAAWNEAEHAPVGL